MFLLALSTRLKKIALFLHFTGGMQTDIISKATTQVKTSSEIHAN